MWNWFKKLEKLPLLGQYVVDPIVTAFEGAYQYARNLTYSVLLIKKLHHQLGEMSDERAVKQSRDFLLTSLGLSATIFTFIAFLPEEPAGSRKELVMSWLSDMMGIGRIALLFCVQAPLTWFFVRRLLRANFSSMRFFALMAFFYGGPSLLLVTTAHSIEFGIPAKLLLRFYPTRLEIEGTLGICVIFLGFFVICAYLWPLVRMPRWRSVLIAALLWFSVAFAVFAVESVISGNSFISKIRLLLTEKKYSVNTDMARQVAFDEGINYMKQVALTGVLPAPGAVFEQSTLVKDPWGNPIVCELLHYMDQSGTPRPYWLAISAGPNRKLDITDAVLANLRKTLMAGRFADVEQVNRAVDLALKPYDPKIGKDYSEKTWEKVDVFGTGGITEGDWQAVLKYLKNQPRKP